MNGKNSTKQLIQAAIFGTLSALLMFIQVPYPGAPWLKLDISDVPILICSFAVGPWMGVVVLFIRNLIFAIMKFNPIELVGIPMNTIATGIMVIVAGYVYHLRKTRSNAIIAIFLGILASIIVMLPANYFIYPWFIRTFFPSIPIPAGKELVKVILFVILPFNAIKDTFNGIATFLVYKRVVGFFRSVGIVNAIPAQDMLSNYETNKFPVRKIHS